jgi:outer membrane protein TolC
MAATSGAKELSARSLDSPGLKRYVESKYPGKKALEWPPRKWSLELLTLVAFHFNADLEAARAKLAAAQAAVTTAGQRPNPTLQLPLQRALNPKDGESPWTLGLALDIPVETHGKRDYRIAQANHLEAAARLQVANTAWNLRSQLREQLLALGNHSEKVRLLQQQVELDQSLVALLQKRLQEGYISARDLNQQQLALIQSNNELLGARRESRAARIKVAELLGLKSSALDGIELDLAEFVEANPPLPTDQLQSLALLNRADVLEALESYEASQAALQLEVARQYPDVHLGPGYTLDQGVRKPGFDFSGIELPIFNRNEGPIAEARARRQEAAANVKRAQAKAWSELDAGLMAYHIARNALDQADKQFMVQQEQLAGTRRAFKLGEEDRVTLELNRKTELSARLAVFDASVQVQQALGRIEDAIQRPISAIDRPFEQQDRPK